LTLGFINAVNPKVVVASQLMELYYLAFPLGFVISFLAYWGLNALDEPKGLGDMDETDYFGTFTAEEAEKMGLREASDIEGVEAVNQKTESNEKIY
jgi:NCS1 family nucleobase:cation symporter-1